MNDALITFARMEILDGLKKCTPKQQHLFKQMYSHNNLHASIEDVVKNIPDEKLDWAMQQIQRTLSKEK